jgi:hypothetical protein
MGLRFTVLASGSKGNASLVQTGRFGLLLDAGLGPRQLSARLAAVGASWQSINAVLLTHAHSDHWNERTFIELHRRRVPIHCYPEHAENLLACSLTFRALADDRLVHTYHADRELMLASELCGRPLALRHDGGATFGFRLEWTGARPGEACTLGYVADLGCWDRRLVQALAEVDLLAVEFNHDVGLEYASGRQPRLIARVLGDEGHLSNVQAAGLLREVLRLSTPGRLRHVVQLHLSQDCNRPDLAAAAAQEVLRDLEPSPELHTARQDRPGPTLHLGGGPPLAPTHRPLRPRQTSRPRSHRSALQPWLPGFENE